MNIGTDSSLPKARTTDLITEPVGDELVVYDTQSSEAHALKPLASAVFAAANGATSIAELAMIASSQLGIEVDISQVEGALEELASTGLLEDAEMSGISRRHLLQVGSAAAAGVLVSSALVPALAAASTPPCVPEISGTLSCGFSELAVVIQQDGTNNYYAMKLDASSNTTSCGAFTYCNGISVTSYNGYLFQTPCTGMSMTQGKSGIAVYVPTGYTLVAWYFHNGTPASGLTCNNGVVKGCIGPVTSGFGCGQSGCIQINPCAAAGC